jgi:hypothetical protein
MLESTVTPPASVVDPDDLAAGLTHPSGIQRKRRTAGATYPRSCSARSALPVPCGC